MVHARTVRNDHVSEQMPYYLASGGSFEVSSSLTKEKAEKKSREVSRIRCRQFSIAKAGLSRTASSWVLAAAYSIRQYLRTSQPRRQGKPEEEGPTSKRVY